MFFVSFPPIPFLSLFAYLIDSRTFVFSFAAVHVWQSNKWLFRHKSCFLSIILLMRLELCRIFLSRIQSSFIYLTSAVLVCLISLVLVYPTSAVLLWWTWVLFVFRTAVAVACQCPWTISAVSGVHGTTIRFVLECFDLTLSQGKL